MPESERQLRNVAGQSARDGNYQLASTATGDLVELLIGANRLAEALRVLEQKAGYARQAGAGPWTRLSGQGQRLRILGLMGRRREVFSDGAVLLAQADKLPEHADSSETVIPWQVTENILDTCRVAAWNLGEWQACLDLNARLIASRRRRGADSREISMARFSDVVPLAELGRLSEAGQLLQACQEDCEEHGDNTWFAAILTTRAGLEGKLGHHDAAVDLERTYLRLMYVRPEPWHTAASHWRLGSYLNKAGIDPAGQRAHLSAAALIFRLIRRTSDLAGAEHALARLVPGNSGPATLGEVIAAAERTDGVHLGELICVLEPDRYAAESAFAQIQHAVASLPSPTGGTISGLLKRWGPAAVSMARSTLNRLAADNGGQEQ